MGEVDLAFKKLQIKGDKPATKPGLNRKRGKVTSVGRG